MNLLPLNQKDQQRKPENNNLRRCLRIPACGFYQNIPRAMQEPHNIVPLIIMWGLLERRPDVSQSGLNSVNVLLPGCALVICHCSPRQTHALTRIGPASCFPAPGIFAPRIRFHPAKPHLAYANDGGLGGANLFTVTVTVWLFPDVRPPVSIAVSA